MAHLRAPNLTPVPLPIPRSRTQTHTISYTYTPAPSPSPSSLEAWRNKPKRIEGWSRTLPPPPAPGERSWGKGVGVGSAEWSGTTAETGRSRGGHPLQTSGSSGREEEVRKEREDGGGVGMDKTDGGTEPTTFKNGRLPKSERAGEVVREQRRLGSQGSAASRSAPHLPQMGSGRGGSTTNFAVPVIIPAPVSVNTRTTPTPFLALPSPLPPHHRSHHPTDDEPPVRPVPTRSQGSDVSAHSARSLRDAFIEAALHIPLDLLNEVQAEPPHFHPPANAPKGVGEPVRKSKSNVSQRALAKPSDTAEGVRKAKSGASGTENRQPEGGRNRGERRSSGVPLEPVKTWPRANPRSVKADLTVGQTGLPARTSSKSRPANDFLSPDLTRQVPVPSPQPRSPFHPAPAEAGPSSSVRTACAPSPNLPPIRPSQPHNLDSTYLIPTPSHRRPTPALRPALSRSGGSFDALARRQREGSMTNLQTRFEPNTYPLPMSGTTASRDLSPVRPFADEITGRSMGSGTSHKARMPIHIAPEAPTLTPGSSTERDNPYKRDHPQPLPTHAHRAGSPRRHLPEIIIGPSSDTHLRVSHSHLDPNPSPRAPYPAPNGDETPREEDRISFEIPSSGTRGRLRVSLAWFKDVRSPKRWRDRVGLSPSPRSEVPPPLPSKDPRWVREGEGERRDRSPLARSRSPIREERYRPDSPPRSRPRSPVDYRPRSRDQERDRDREYLALPEPDRDRVRFSPIQPQDIRSPPAWPAPSQPHNPYLQPNPRQYIPSPPFIPIQQRQAPFPAYTQPGAWPGMPFGPFSAGPPPPPGTQIPLSPGSVDPPSDGSPPGFSQPLPSFYPPPPTLSGQPYSRPFPYTGQSQKGDLPWSGRPTMWQRMFSAQRDTAWDGEPRRPEGKEGWIKNWRSGVQGGTVFGGTRPNGTGYGDGEREGRGWWRLGTRRRGADVPYPDDDVPYRSGPYQRRGKWPFGLNRPNTTRIGQPGYPSPTYDTPRSGGTGIFFRTRTTNGPYPPPLSGPLSPVRTAEREKEERRAQRKERRDRRNDVGDGRTTLHPFDSVTRAGGDGIAPRRPIVQQQALGQQRAGMANGGTRQGGGRVSEWVQRVSGQRNPVPGVLERKVGRGGEGGVPWKERLKTRRDVVKRDAGGLGGGGGAGGKLRRVDSARQKRQAGPKPGFSLPFSRRQGREGGKGGRVIR